MPEKKDMNYNFEMIIPRLVDAFENLDVEKVNNILSSISHNCICMGTGGSYSASLFASIVLDNANGIITVAKEPRDILFMNLFNQWGHLLGITYGNNNYGITEAETKAREGKLLTHILTTNSTYDEDICYKGSIPNEYSFISLASTIIPMSILLNYYLKTDQKEVVDIIKEMYSKANKINNNFGFNEEITLFEIMSGDNTYVASRVLESTITEAGLGIPVVHEKYSYCHGRSTLGHIHKNNNLIYLVNGEYSNLDNKLLLELKDSYRNIIVLNSIEKDFVVGEFDLALQSLFLCKIIAQEQSKDLSKVEYADVVRKLYYYKGGM